MDGSTLIGQNSDMEAEMQEFAYVLHLMPDHRGLSWIMWTFGGMIGYHGLNEYGVSHFANSLGGGPQLAKFALFALPAQADDSGAEESRRRASAHPRRARGLKRQITCLARGPERSRILKSRRGAIEIARSQIGFLTHANHFLCGEHACEANWEQSPPDSHPRQLRADTFLSERAGKLTLEDAKQLLANHQATRSAFAGTKYQAAGTDSCRHQAEQWPG